MPVICDGAGVLYHPVRYDTEKSFEAAVVSHADQMFGESAVYIDVKKRVRGDFFVTIPDGYVIDMADVQQPRLFVVENEIVSHDPFRHIGSQMLTFVTCFEEAQLQVRNFLMEQISIDAGQMERLKSACASSSLRNIDAYLDRAVYGRFRGLVIIDEARPELHRVIEKIHANISVLEFKSFRSEDGRLLHIFDSLYDEVDEPEPTTAGEDQTQRQAKRAARLARRARSDTVVVPAREEGFQRVFLGEDRWHSIRIGAAMKERLRYIAAYQTAPVSAVTHIAEIADIRPWEDTGKYLVIFQSPAVELPRPVPVRENKNAPQGPVYVERERLKSAESLEEALS